MKRPLAGQNEDSWARVIPGNYRGADILSGENNNNSNDNNNINNNYCSCRNRNNDNNN